MQKSFSYFFLQYKVLYICIDIYMYTRVHNSDKKIISVRLINFKLFYSKNYFLNQKGKRVIDFYLFREFSDCSILIRKVWNTVCTHEQGSPIMWHLSFTICCFSSPLLANSLETCATMRVAFKIHQSDPADKGCIMK